MYIKCKGFCKLCNNPLNPYMKSNDFKIRKLIRSYRKINPIFLCNNDCFYKFFGRKLNRVCYSCFVRFKKPSMTNLRDREIGAIKDLQEHKPLSLSSREIYMWFINLQNYVKRHLKNCL